METERPGNIDIDKGGNIMELFFSVTPHFAIYFVYSVNVREKWEGARNGESLPHIVMEYSARAVPCIIGGSLIADYLQLVSIAYAPQLEARSDLRGTT
jgi:hypothetical protein